MKTASSLITGASSSGMGRVWGENRLGWAGDRGGLVFFFFTVVNFVMLACALAHLQWRN